MKNLLLCYMVFHILIQSSILIEVWNFKNASDNLLNQENDYKHSFEIYSHSDTEFDVSLRKNISKNDDKIIDINILEVKEKINSIKYSFNVEFEDINNIFYYGNILHICPKGKYHPLYFNENAKNLTNHIMYNFPEKANDWDLKCNLYNDLFIAIYPNNNFIYSYNSYLKGWNKINFYFALEDIMWKNIKSKENLYQVPGLTIVNSNNMDISNLYFINDYSIGFEAEKNQLLKYNKSFTKLYFGQENNFYFLTYENNHIDSGYYNKSIEIQIENIEEIPRNLKFNSFSFDNNVKIESIDIVKGTRYAYYKIDNNNKKYYGIFDILTNKILFNTDEAITKFISYSKLSMLAITKDSAYEICVLSIDGKCVEKCDNDQIILNPEGKNYCECPVFYFKPSYKCLDNCDTNFYTQEEKYCGLCKDLGGDKIYKLINTEGCLEEIPNNTIFYDEEKLLLTCDNRSHLENETCVLNSKKDDDNIVEEKEDEVDYIFYIFVSIIVIVFLIISIIIFVKLCSKNKKDDLLVQIDTDFEPKNSEIN